MKKIFVIVFLVLQFCSICWAETPSVEISEHKLNEMPPDCNSKESKKLLLALLLDDYIFTLSYRYPSDITISKVTLVAIEKDSLISRCKAEIFRPADPVVGKKLIKEEIEYMLKWEADGKITIVFRYG